MNKRRILRNSIAVGLSALLAFALLVVFIAAGKEGKRAYTSQAPVDPKQASVQIPDARIYVAATSSLSTSQNARSVKETALVSKDRQKENNPNVAEPATEVTLEGRPPFEVGAPPKPELPPLFIESYLLDEKEVNLKAIVLVRCFYKSQYFAISSQPQDEVTFGAGTGVIVSPSGYILTAAHVVRDKSLGTDMSGRTWTQDKCQIAETSDYRSEIVANSLNSVGANFSFKDVDIVFEPTESDYLNSTGMDVAVLKLKSDAAKTADFIPLYPKLVAISTSTYSVTSIGYPGKDLKIPQKLERFDAGFINLAALENDQKKACPDEDYGQICGWRYVVGRYYYDFERYYGYFTSLGIETQTVRGGFSGSPTFLKGNLIGLLTHGREHETVGLDANVDVADILTSRDIVEFLKSNGLSFD